MQTPALSKSRIVSGHQCTLRLWNEVFHRDWATPINVATQAIFDAGNEVGELARQRHPGALIQEDHKHPEEALAHTAKVLGDASTLAVHDAAFRHQGVLVRADLLLRTKEGWDLIEVKSSTEVKAVFILDAAVQAWVLRGSGLPLQRIFVMVIDNTYRYEGDHLDLGSLFRLEDVTDRAADMAADIGTLVARFQALLVQPTAPEVALGPHCLEPYECPFLGHCTSHWPEVPDPVEWVPRLGFAKAMMHHEQGLHSLCELPMAALSDLQLRVQTAHRSGTPWVSGGLTKALRAFDYPVHHLDFETFAHAVPKIPNSRPYEAVPVQWSCHTQEVDGTLRHSEFLADGLSDPREIFAIQMLDALGEHGTICVYSPYEQRILNELAVYLPCLAPRLRALSSRIVDLLPIVRNHIYLPAFQGSFSIKKVLPALVPDFSYAGLAVQDGLQAGVVFAQMRAEPDPDIQARLRQDLLTYCGQDTLAMVKVREALSELSTGK